MSDSSATTTGAALPALSDTRIGIVGLGYVGLPLALAFARRYPTLGYDISEERIKNLRAGYDRTGYADSNALATSGLRLSTLRDDLRACNVYVLTVPTPVDAATRPDLSHLLRACADVGTCLAPGNVVVIESSVYPGATEEDCVPVLERASELTASRDFHIGYSPERMNPGDEEHRLDSLTKVIAGATEPVADFLEALYGSVIPAGTHRAPSIRVAEAAKIVENLQRDVNIALMNELSVMFDRLGIDTGQVLETALTKWNFLPFRPGLVGGHCVSVDPYFMIHRARAAGVELRLASAAREINEGMAGQVARRMATALQDRGINANAARVLVLGFTFKENCPDVRNTKVLDLIEGLACFGLTVDVHDPWADPVEASRLLGPRLIPTPPLERYDAVILAVPHLGFLKNGVAWIRQLLACEGLIFDLKSALPFGEGDFRL